MGNLRERHYPVKDSHFRASARHAVNGTTGLILAYGQTTLTMDGAHSLRPV